MTSEHVDQHEAEEGRARRAREEAVGRTADDGVQGGAEAPQDEEASVRAAVEDLGEPATAEGPGGGGPTSSEDARPQRSGLARDRMDDPTPSAARPASGSFGDATYGSGLGRAGDDGSEPATESAGRPAPGREHLEAPPEARDPAAEAPETLGIDDTDTALADEDTTTSG